MLKEATFVLDDLFIGYNDGKKEAIHRENFEDYYFNYNKLYEKILQKDKYLVLGKKGTGKTLLGEYIRKKAMLEGERWICETVYYKSFKFQNLFSLRTNDIKPNEYTAIWEWLLLLKLASVCINNIKHKNDAIKKLEAFLKSNFFGLKLDMNKVVEETKKNNIKGGLNLKFMSTSKEVESDTKIVPGTYLDYLDDLKRTVWDALASKKFEYTIILDELDDQFRNEVLYKSNIISLIKTVDKLNYEFNENGYNVKFIIMLRSDIFYVLNDADLNKIEQDNSVKINWGNCSNKNSPLITMILLKMQQSIGKMESKEISIEHLYSYMFPCKFQTKEKSYDAAEFILGRTYLRPRDLITFLRCAINVDSQQKFFTDTLLRGALKEYSNYLLKEIRNEMHGHVEDIVIDEAFSLIRQFKRKSFNYNDIEKYFNNNRDAFKHIELKEVLKLLFDFGVIGNKWVYKGRLCYSWSHRENTTIDYEKGFNIHMGLRTELNLL